MACYSANHLQKKVAEFSQIFLKKFSHSKRASFEPVSFTEYIPDDDGNTDSSNVSNVELDAEKDKRELHYWVTRDKMLKDKMANKILNTLCTNQKTYGRNDNNQTKFCFASQSCRLPLFRTGLKHTNQSFFLANPVRPFVIIVIVPLVRLFPHLIKRPENVCVQDRPAI